MTDTSFVKKLGGWFWSSVSKFLDAVATGMFYAAIGSFLSGIGVLCYQGLFWLKYGTWESITIFDVLKEILPLPFLRWFVHPDDWVGFHTVMVFVLSSSIVWLLAFLVVPLIYGVSILSAYATLAQRPSRREGQGGTSLEDVSRISLLLRRILLRRARPQESKDTKTTKREHE